MRRVLSSVTVVLGLIGVSLGPAGAVSAAPTPGPSDGTGGQAAVPGKKVCAIDDPRLVELSGMVAVKSGYIVINDGSDFSDRKKIFFLNAECNVAKVKPYSGSGPRDTEDMGVSPDGTLYIADIGDNDKTRDTVALWTMPVNGSAAPMINRLTYPDGKHDAEALLFNGDGTPIIVTRESGKAALYSPAGPLKAGTREGVPMKKLGEIKLTKTATPNWLNALGGLVVTGGATAPDGSRVVLRTYADAFEWDVTNGDVATAVTTGTPRVTPLPDEPRGEAIAYSTDGKSFLTVSETADQPAGTLPEILSYTPATSAAPAAVEAAATQDGDTRSWLDKLTLDDITYLIAAVGVIGVVLVGVGVFGIVRARRKPSEDDSDAALGQAPGPDDPLAAGHGGYDDPGWGQLPSGPGEGHQGGRPRSAGGVYGGGVYGAGSASGGGRSGGSVYGGKQSGGVYGGKPSGGAVYGGGSSGGGYGGRGDADDGNRSGNGYADRGYSNQGYDEERTGRYGNRKGRQPDYPDDHYGYH